MLLAMFRRFERDQVDTSPRSEAYPHRGVVAEQASANFAQPRGRGSLRTCFTSRSEGRSASSVAQVAHESGRPLATVGGSCTAYGSESNNSRACVREWRLPAFSLVCFGTAGWGDESRDGVLRVVNVLPYETSQGEMPASQLHAGLSSEGGR
jgi:hypothetical protein